MPSRLPSPPCDLAHATVASRSANSMAVGLGIDDREQLLHVVDLGEIDAAAEIIIGRHRESAEMAKAADDVFDIFVQAENLHADENDRRILHAGRTGVIDRHVAARDLDRGVAGVETGRIGLDDVGAHRAGGERVTRGGGGRARHESAPRQRRHDFGQSDDVGRQALLVHVTSPGRWRRSMKEGSVLRRGQTNTGAGPLKPLRFHHINVRARGRWRVALAAATDYWGIQTDV